MFDRYLAGLEAGLPTRPMAVLPGVMELVAALSDVEDVALALLTGNIEGGARLKLTASGLHARFATGSYGSDSERRDDLPGVAMERARDTWGVSFDADAVFVIGDTPRDVSCGRNHGTQTVAVATGRFAADELAAAGAHHVVPDFRDTRAVLDILAG